MLGFVELCNCLFLRGILAINGLFMFWESCTKCSLLWGWTLRFLKLSYTSDHSPESAEAGIARLFFSRDTISPEALNPNPKRSLRSLKLVPHPSPKSVFSQPQTRNPKPKAVDRGTWPQAEVFPYLGVQLASNERCPQRYPELSTHKEA